MSAHNPYEGTTPIYVDHVPDVVASDAEEVVETSVEETPAPAAPAPETVPEGSIKEVLAWVGNDRQRAAQALTAEVDGANRKTLTAALREIL